MIKNHNHFFDWRITLQRLDNLGNSLAIEIGIMVMIFFDIRILSMYLLMKIMTTKIAISIIISDHTIRNTVSSF